MTRLLLFIFLVIASPTLAQEKDKDLTFILTPQEVVIVGNALSARPYSEVVALLAKLQQQISQQQKPIEK